MSAIRDDFNIPMSIHMQYVVGGVGARCRYVSLRTGVDRKTQTPVAIKVYHKTKMGSTKEASIFSELSLMRRIRHQNVLRLMGDLDTPTEHYLVTEMPKGGDLFETIISSPIYSEVDASRLFFQLCHAICFLHSINVVHRCIRPESIMVIAEPDGQQLLKLCDFTLATEIVDCLNFAHGNLAYMAPELLSDEHWFQKGDVWSAGVVGYLMLCGFVPYPCSDRENLLSRIRSGLDFPSPAWDMISDAAKDMLRRMLEADVNIRSKVSDVLDHPWLENERNMDNLQPAVGINLLKLTTLDSRRRIFSTLIGLRHLDRRNSQLQLEVYNADEVPSYPSAASTSSTPRMGSAPSSPHSCTAGGAAGPRN